MSRDLNSWLASVRGIYRDESPNLDWTTELPPETPGIECLHFHSFRAFACWPMINIAGDTELEGKMMIDTDPFQSLAKSLLSSLPMFDITDIGGLAVMALALGNDATLLSSIPKETPALLTSWCAAQCVSVDPRAVMSIWRGHLFHPPPMTNRVALQASLLLLDFCISTFQPSSIPPFTSDEFETVFCLAYCSKRSEAPRLAGLVLRHLCPLIVESGAAHLLFRRMLPYCAMEDHRGRKVALQTVEEVIGHHMRFPSCVSTWITMHRMFLL
jgi:hypothetical protein